MGELFHAMIIKQFTDLRDGDRFWYERDLNDEELELLADVTLANAVSYTHLTLPTNREV